MITLVLGGTRSGKSAVAERVAGPGPVTYVATAFVDPADADHQARIEAHRARRPASWTTVECQTPGNLAPILTETQGTVLVDSIGSWVAAHEDMQAIDTRSVLTALAARSGDTIIVSEEVGFSVHAPTAAGRSFVDALGTINQALSAVADRAVLVVAGRIIDLPPPPDEGQSC